MLPAGRTVIQWLASTQLSIILFGTLSIAAIPGTFLKSQRDYYSHPVFVFLLAAFAFQLAICTLKRWQTLAGPTLVVHTGVLIVLVGALLTGSGYIATINIYEGESSKTVYRWDLKQDTPFGHEIKVKKINFELRPTPLKIGVMKGSEKHALQTLKTGETFLLEGYAVTADKFDPVKETVTLSVKSDGKLIGTADTAGTAQLPADFPFSFKLVSFRKSAIKRFWVELELLDNGQVITSGTTEINAPLNWQGLDFFNTEISFDQQKRAYAGIQIVRDPGKYVVYAGMFILSVGTIAAWYRRFKR